MTAREIWEKAVAAFALPPTIGERDNAALRDENEALRRSLDKIRELTGVKDADAFTRRINRVAVSGLRQSRKVAKP